MRDYPKGLIGRIWPTYNHVSFWNYSNAFTATNMEGLEKVIAHMKCDLADLTIEFINENSMWQTLKWDEFKQEVQRTFPKPVIQNSEMQSKLHTLSPEIKNVVMKQMGIKPKQGADIRDRFHKQQGD
jgi:hypothetical protein